MPDSVRPMLVVLGLSLAAAPLPSCASPARTTRISVDDFQLIAAEMAQKLRGGDLLRERTADSPRMVVALRRAENLTMDLLGDAERWYLVEKVASSLPLVALAREKNLVWVTPEQKGRAAGQLDPADFPPDRRPTHTLLCIVQSITRSAGLDRSDLYRLEYRIEELRSGEIKWVDQFEYKRAATGLAYD